MKYYDWTREGHTGIEREKAGQNAVLRVAFQRGVRSGSGEKVREHAGGGGQVRF